MEEKRLVRDFKLSSLAIDNRTSIFVIIFMIVVMGLVAYTTMPKENFPEINIPQVFVTAVYPGNSPLDMENLITRPIEKEINTITGVDDVTSTSIQDFANIVVVFDLSVDPDKALREVKDAIDRSELPNDMPNDPIVRKMDFGNLPVMNINLSGYEDIDILKEYAEYLQDEIEKFSEISSVKIAGIQEKEVSIKVDVNKLSSRNMAMRDVEGAIAGENLTISGGDILQDGLRRNIRVVGEFSNIKELENVIVKNEKESIVYLRDIAEVDFGYQETSSYSRGNKKPVVTLDILKRSGTNLLDASDKVKELLARAGTDIFPEQLNVQLINDTSKQTRDMVDNLENSIISGVILVVLVLLFFLGLRNAAFVGIAIPLSMLMGFIILQFAGATLNMMVLFSLILALGMLVDNGIVVVENIYRLMQEGLPPIQAAKEGVGEVAMPIIASTATTLAAFLPLLFWDGIMGEFMKFLPMTLIIVLASSLFVGLVVNPVLASVFMKVESPDDPVNYRGVLSLALVTAILAGLFYFVGFNDAFKFSKIVGSVLFGGFALLLLYTFVVKPLVVWTKNRKSIGPDVISNKTNYPSILGFLFLLLVFGITFSIIEFNKNAGLSRVMGSLMAIVSGMSLIQTFIFRPLSNLFLTQVMPRLEWVYKKFLRFALSSVMPYLFFLGAIVLFIGSILFMGSRELNQVIFPDNEPNQVYIYSEYPIGTDIEKTNTLTQEIEDIVIGVLEPYEYMVEAVLANVGKGAGNPQDGFNTSATPNKSRVSIFFLEYVKRKGVSTTDVMEEVRESLTGFPGATIVIEKERNGPPTGPPVNVELIGDDYATLISIADEVKTYLTNEGGEGIDELKINLEKDKPEMLINIDRDKARRYGLSTGMIASDIRTAVFGKEISQYKDGEDEYPINLRFNDEQRYDVGAVLNQKITFKNQSNGRIVQIPVSAVADVENKSTIGSVKRKDLQRVVALTANVLDGYYGKEIVDSYRELMEDYSLPEGYSVRFTGEQEEQEETAAFLMKALIIAVGLIFLIIVSQFNSIIMPAIILMSVLFSTIGVFLGYAFLRWDFIIMMTGIGIISLAGIVVNNAIVLIDYTNLVRQRQRKELALSSDTRMTKDQVVDAIVESGATRLRPVLLTAITTVLGLIPLAVGFNIDFGGLLRDFTPGIYFGGDNVIFWGPMAWTVIFGLIFATFLTLVIVPVMYLIFDRMMSLFFGRGLNTA